jgi:two-component system response regulator AtoC
MGTRPHILVVDDPAIADTLGPLLEGEGYEVETASNTDSAMLHIEQRQFSLALVGRILDGDRLGLLQLLKSKDPSLQVIIMTGSQLLDKVLEPIKQGAAFYYLQKPFELEEMLVLIEKALERRSLLAENSDLRRKLAEQSGTGSSPTGG